MSWSHLKLFLLFQSFYLTICLITKNYTKVPVNGNAIKEYIELASIPQVDFFECSYLCMKLGETCKAFHITKDGSCRQVPLDQDFLKGSSTLFTTEPIEYSKQDFYCFFLNLRLKVTNLQRPSDCFDIVAQKNFIYYI